MSNAKNLHDVSAIYFFILAFIYVFAVLAFRNGFMPDLMLAVMRILDVPFAMIALMYGGTTIYMQIEKDEEEASPWAMIIFAICLLILGFVIFLNYAFPSQL